MITKITSEIVKLPSGQELSAVRLLHRLTNGCGFDADWSRKYLDAVNDGGVWLLELTDREIRKVSGVGDKQPVKGFS